MAVALVGLVVGRLASVVEQQARDEINLVVGVKKEVENLSRKLNIIRRVLDDAERRKLKEKDVQGWILDLENLSYDMDDMLDEWNTALMKMQQEGVDSAENASASREKITSSLFSPCFCFKRLVVRRDIAVKIKELNSRLDTVNRDKDQFRFLESGQVDDQESFRQVKSTSFVKESEVYGRGLDKEVVLRMLLLEGSQETNSMNVITILGSGGLGKTTLAQVVYNDREVDRQFSKKIWVCVSDPFDEIRVARAVLEALGASSPDLHELESLLQRIKYFISGKRFLLVLDDVWNEDERKWESLRNSFEFGSPESKILVTTRSERVARVIGTRYLHRLGELSESDCWNIFSLTAFAGRKEKIEERFGAVGKNIVKRCKGLPLAAKTLGGLLRFRDSIEEWQKVLDSEIWELEEAALQLFPHLYLSYNDLPPIMKRCFSYCAVFPKDSQLYVNKLIRIWTAQGFLTSNGSEDYDIELKGRECFENLAMRSFFQEFENDRDDEMIISCKMHDIVHDFAQFLTKNECWIAKTVKIEADMATDSPHHHARHLTWLHAGNATSSSAISSMENLRSFYVINLPQKQLNSDLMKSLNRARVLSLSHCKLQEIPKQVGTLLHLRYLDLTDNPVRELPETICNLSNLQTLELQHCSELSSLPSSIDRLLNLRHLDIQWTTSLLHLPETIRRLSNLRTLSEFVIGGGNKFGWLENLNQLQGSLRISFIEDLNKASDVAEVEKALFRNKKHIKEFILLFNGCKVTLDVVEALQPPPNVQILEIWNFSIGQFPGWISTSVSNLRVLVIRECSNCASLPPLGKLPLLESLELIALYDLKHVGREFLGFGDITSQDAVITFPKLQKFVVFYCFDWIDWEDLSEEEEVAITVMPRLQHLELKGCSKLRTLPPRLLRKASSLESLSILYCDELENTLARSKKSVDSKELIDQIIRGIP